LEAIANRVIITHFPIMVLKSTKRIKAWIGGNELWDSLQSCEN